MMSQSHERKPDHDPLAFLVGGGEMGARTRALDWSRTPLGPVEGWPQSLRSALSICLNSSFPIALYWGSGLVVLYNDDWSPIPGEKHPWALGRPAREVWSEIWEIIDPLFEQVVTTGRATRRQDQLLPMRRHGFTEECYFDYTFSPVRGESGNVDGVFNAVVETTTRVVGERRLRTLRELAARTTEGAKSVEDACKSAARLLSENPHDLPFVLLYLLESDGQRATLAGQAGVGRDSPISPAVIELSGDGPWPFRQIAETGKAVEVHDLPEPLGPLPGGAWPEPSRQVVVLPMTKPGQIPLAGFVVAGVSPRLALNEDYKTFLDLLAGHVATAVATARAYEEERRRAETLAELDRAKTLFFTNVSHEFRTPLTLMLGPVEDLLARSHTDLPPAAAGQLEVVNRNGLRLLRLVNSLLDFSRIEAGRFRAVYQPTDLASFTAELASVFRSACERAGLRLAVDCPPLGEAAFVDREMWEKVVLNLLSNAFKFTFEGEIAVSLRQVGRMAELRVRDTGTGIPAEEMPKLFERFHRIENAQGRTHEGSGIGLALVQELVKLHGGSVTAESVMGEGTTFTVTVPLGKAHLPPDQIGDGRTVASTGTGASPYVEEALRWLPDEGRDEGFSELPTYHEPLPTPHRPSGPDGDNDRPRVLVADDNADMRQYVVRLLAEQFQVEAVADGEAALAAAKERPPDLILTDVMMPRLNGFGLLKELRADPRTSGLPIIMLSARAGEESRVEGMEAGADDYLVKPFSARELLARVAAHLQMARMRREASETLRESEQRYRLLVEQTVDGIFVADAEGRYVDVNSAGCEMLGYTREEVLARTLTDVLAPEEWPRVTPEVARFADGRVAQSEWRFRRKDGSGFIGEISGRQLPDGRLQGVVRDITARKRAEEELQEERDRLRVTLASIGDAVITTDTAGHVTNLNAVAESLTGWNNDEAAGQPLHVVFNIVNEQTRQPVENPATRALREGVIVGLANHTVLIRKDGTERPIDDSAAPIRGEEGDVVGCVLVFRDVTERRRAEGELQLSRLRMDLVVNSVDVGLWYCDLPFDKLIWNAKVKEHFGLPADYDVTIGTFYERLHPGDRERTRQAIETAIHDRTPYDIEYRTVGLDGRERWVRAIGRTFYGAAGTPTRFDGVTVDVTERVRQEHELRQMAAELSDASRKKDEFLATLAHELRNPLAPIRNALQIIRLSPDREARDQARTMMERQLSQMVRLVDDLMDVSRITRGKVDLKKERVRLSAVVSSAVETSRPLIEQMGHELTVMLTKHPVVVDADLTRLAQVFSNLLNNAAKYTERGGHIRLTAERQGSDVVVSVKDTGIGIPADKLTSIFEMFSQVDRSLERAQGGLGIGLTLVRRLVELHGGSVEAKSGGHGMGSEFIVRLPVVLSLAGQRDAGSGVRATANARRRILVVDDNRDSAISLAMMLKLMDNETQTAHDGLEALEVAAAFRPDVILLDIGMPKLNGYDTCLRIRQQSWGKSVVLVALTGWGQEDDRRRSREAGFNFHMVKPVDPAALEKLLAELQTTTE